MKAIIQRIRTAAMFAVLFAIGLASTAWATTDKTNPVTGATESYTYNYTGAQGDGVWTTAANWNPNATPYISGASAYAPALIDGNGTEINVSGSGIDGWEMKLGVYGGAKVTISNLQKWTGGNGSDYATVDSSSKLTITSMAAGNWNHVVSYYVAAPAGVTYSCEFTAKNTGTIHYYLKGNGSVSYQALNGLDHVIKQADVTLSGTSKVEPKTLVSFTSSTKTFTASADIKVYDTDGTTLKETVAVTSVRSSGAAIQNTTSALTTADAVGTCELVQCTDGIVLYYVDGDPSDVVAKTYTPSININFCHGNAPLTTAADVGYGDYAVPGTSWNNMVSAGGNNGTFTTPLSTIYGIDSTGAQKAISGASVAVSGTRGSWSCPNLAVASDLRNGYVDESSSGTTPTVTVSGIPYDQYKVVVYTATDAANVTFGYITINGTDYTYADGAVAEDTTAWGASGAYNTAEALAEGVNVLVSPVVSGATLTVVGHRSGDNPRGCIAAVQIVKVEQQVGENDLLIELDGDRTYTFDEAKTYSGTVYVLGEGTLTFDGAASTAATLHIGPAASVNMVGSSLTPTAVTGNGTVVYDGVKPMTGLGWTDSANWTGTVWVKNITTSNDARRDWNPALYGNAESTLRFTDVNLYFPNNTTTAFSGTVELDAGGLNICDGYGGSIATFARLSGSGTLSTSGGSSNGNGLTINDASAFTGTITLTKFKVVIGTATGTSASGVLQIDSGAVATVASGKTWTAPGGFVVNGTLNADGTLASSHASQAVSGSGTVVFAGKMPSPTTDVWWKNAAWTGTVQIKSAAFTGVSGVDTYLDVNKYGNDGSVLELNNCSGWLPVGNTTGDNVCAVPLKVTGTLTINDGYSNRKFTINKLLGNGAIYTTNNGATVTIQVLSADDFTGYVNLNSKRVIFGETVPETFTSGQIYVGEGFTFTVPNSNVAWYGTGGITLAGELKAAALSNFGGGTTITTTDTGVFTLTSTGNGTEGETDTDYARIQGTGSLKYEGAGWRALTTNKLSTAVALVNEQAGDILLSRALTYTIGSLSGSKNFQGNYGSGKRYLNVIQSKDTEWSGKVVNDGSKRFAGLKLDASSTGTLTLSGTASQEVALEVNGGAVNLTGTWVGATTVAGTFGGTGTLTGNLTFNAGSTFKVFDAAGDGTADTDTDGLNVSGAVTVGDSGTVTIADGASIASETVILKATSISGTFELDSSLAEDYELTTTATTLTITPIDHNIYTSDGETVVGYMDGTTAVITNTAAAVPVPASTAAIQAYPTSNSASLIMTLAQAQALLSNMSIYATYKVGGVTYQQDITSAFTSSTVFGENVTVTMTLSGSDVGSPNTVVVDEETITVTPALDTSATPMAVGAAEAEFMVKTIPGLFYGVVYGSDNSTFKAKSGNVVQATTTSTTLEAPTDDIDGVRYFKIQVGVAASDFEVYSEE